MLTLSLLHQSILLSSYNWQAIFAVILDISQEIELPHFLLVWFINNCAAVLLVRTMMNCKSKAYGTGYWYYPVLNLKHSRSNEKISVKIAHHLADYHSNDKMARTRSFLVDVVPMYAMITNRESRGIVPLVLSQTPDYPAHCLVTMATELSQFQVFSVCITLTICLCVCHVLWTGWGRRAAW